MILASASLLPLADGLETLIWIVVVVGSIAAQIAKASRRAGKKADHEPGLPPRQGEPPPLSPEDELRRFIESLSGGGGSRSQPSSPAAPPPLRAPSPRPPATAPAAALPMRPAPPALRPRPARAAATPPARKHRQAPRPRRDQAERRRATTPTTSRPARTRRPVVPPVPAPAPAVATRPARRPAHTPPTPPPGVEPQVAAAAEVPSPAQAAERRRVGIGGRLFTTDVLRSAVVWREILAPPVALRSRAPGRPS